ncbi:MAG: hypothetical protein HYZ92_04730, partial [Candidatus Omnitrophica bacterium]|nr:hypothetical protein [Candidatus Omnitrophota bacterium]
SGAPDGNGEYSFPYTIPTNASLTVGNSGKIKVKVVSPSNQTAIEGISNGFQIKGSITLVGPTGATDLIVGGSKTVEWTPNGNISKFRIQYKTSAGGSWTEISPAGGCVVTTCFTVNGANRTWSWTNIPDAIGNDVWLRVADYDNDNVAGASAAANVIKGILDLQTPDDAPLAYYIGDNAPITWRKKGSIGNIKIEQSAKGDFTDTVVINSSYASGADDVDVSLSPVWTAPSKVAETFKIRITNNVTPLPPAGTELTDISTAAFGVRPKITGISSPGSGNTWNVGDTAKVITWSATSATKTDGITLPKVKFQYLVAGGTWTDVLDLVGSPAEADCANGTNNYTWVRGVADERSDDVKIRVYFMDYAGTSEGLDSPSFKIYPVITVSNPIGTDQLVVGTNYANLITWSRTGTKSGSFKVLYSTDGTSFPDPANVLATLQTVTNGTTGVSWNIPAATALTNTAKIRVIDEANTNVYGDSAAFKLKGGLTLTAPAANATVTAASTTNTIGWNFTGGIGNVTAKYDPNSGLGADGIGGTTDDYPTTIGTKSQAGTSGSSTLNWDLSSAAGGTNTTAVTNTGRIKIVDDADPTNVLSTVDVKIGANLDLTAPESGALCYAEDPCTISWNSLAGTGVTDVKLEYTNNDSNASPTWVEIDPAVTKANISPYIWTPTPGTLADLANDNRMRLSQKAPLNAAVVSTGTGTAFRIKAALDVTVPGAGTESWDAGSPYVIKFKKKGAVQTVNLYYDHNNGLGADGVVSADDYATLINNATPIDLSLLTPDAQGQYSYTWTIASATPLTAGFAGKIKAKIVTPASQNDVFDVQTNSIEVKGAVTLLTPTATGIILDVGQDYAVTWSKSGAVNNVKLHYSRTGGIVGGGSYPTDDSTLMTTVPSTPSSYTWAVPDKIGTNLRIRVMDAGNANVWNESTNAFRIRGKLLLTQPDLAGISWTVGSSQTISWTTTGTFSPVQLDYATDGDFGGTNVFPVLPLASVTNCTASATVPYQCTGSASFTIEDKITAAAKVRIRGSGSETDVASISTNAFKIGGSITAITSPAAGDVWVYPDTTKQIKWTANGTITNVKIAYKTSVGGAYTTIVASDPGHTTGNNTYTWSAGLPDVNTEDAYIQVCDANAAFSSVCLDSAAFRIRPSITVTSPTAGQELVVGTTYNNLIKWSYTGTTITSVKVLYSTSTGTSYPDPDNLITASTVVGNGTAGINWVIPDSLTLTSTEKIKVQDLGNSNVFGESPAFKLKGGLTLSGPSGSGTTIIAASTTNTISWTFTGAVANAKAYYSLNGTAGPWTLIGTKAQTGTSGSSTLNWDLSSAVGGTNTTGVTNTARVKITDAADETNVVSEGADFSIGTQFSNVHPANGEPIYAEDTGTDITWNPGPGTGVTDVKLEYTNNASSGSAWTEIDPGVGKINNGTYRWSPVPGSVNDLQNDNKIRISQKVPLNASSAVMGIGPGLFPIRPTLTVTVPGAGTESWDVGSTHAIKFKKTGAVQKVDVYYAPDALPGPPTWTKLNTTLDPAVNPLGPVDLTLLTPNAQGEYTWTWTVANNTPLTSGFKGKIKVKVFDPASQQSVEGVQANAIEVKGAVTLLTPNGGGTPQQTLVVGSTYTINGTVFGAVSQVQLSISTGGAYNPLSAGNCDSNLTVQPDQTFSCNWTVQNLIGTNLKIRAQDANNANVKDESDGAFAIKGGVTITAPVGGGSPSVWIAGDQHDIAWTLNGSVGLLDLFYNVNDGSYQPIASGVDPGLATGGCSSAPCYRWTLPGNSPSDVIVSSNVKVKISGSTLAADEISGAFRVKGKLTIGTVASEYVLGNTVTLTWTAKGDIGPVKVEYYDGGAANGGVGWQTVTLAASQNGPQPVTLDTKFIPSCSSGCLGSDVATNAAALRITDADEPSVTSTSASFLVKPLLQVSSPIITDRWVAKSSHPITWTFKGSNVGTVKVDYATNAASTNWQPILETEGTADDGIVTNDGSIPWTVADAITYAPAKLVVRLSTQPPTDPWAVTATSAPANVIGALELIQPNDATGIAWRINSSSNQITWKPTGTMTSVNLEYSTDSGSTWPPLGGGTITTTPVAAGTDGLNQSYFWTIPMTTPIVKDTLRIRVCDATITDICDVATAPSSFLANFTVSSPAGGNVWVAESTETISWTTPQAGVPATVKLEYSLNGVTFVPIPETYGTANDGIVANTGTQNVTLGPELSTSARGRISDPSDPNSALVSDPFKIRGALDLKAPDGGQAWEIGTYNLIRWTKKGNITAARLQYTKDATATPTVTWENLPDGETPPRDTQNISVTGPPDGNGEYTFNWKIPDLPGINVTTAKIQVLDASDGTVLDPSAAVFTIKGRVDLTSPDGGLTYGVGANLPIVGTVFGPIATVRVRYSTDDGATYPNANIPTGCGDVNGEVTVAGDRTFSCNWTLPDAVGQNLKVRVCDTGNSTVCDYSTTAFFVKGTLTIINPASGGSPAVWIAGDPQDITWSRTGNIGNVDLFYNVNGGAFAPIASAIDAALATGGCTPAPCYRWTVPDGSGGPIVSSAVKVKIIGGNLLTDAVTGDFKVKGKLTLNYPDGPNLTFTLRDSVNVSWTAKGDIGPVKVEYFDGSAWQTVTTAAAQNGPQPVSLDVKFIPSCSTGCTGTTVATDAGKFRITDPDEASVTDETTNPFMVKPYLLVTNPSTGNEVWVATTPQTLTWDQTGSNIGTVKIEYSSDGGSTYNPIVESEGTANDGIVANDGSFGWTVLDNIAPTTNKKFRFTTQPAADPWAEVKTSSLFKIVGQLTLLKPDETDNKWGVGTTHNITWSFVGTISQVILQYAQNGVDFNTNITPSPISGSLGSSGFAWTIDPATTQVSATGKIRIVDANDGTVTDTAPNTAPLKIVPVFTVTAPADSGGSPARWTVDPPGCTPTACTHQIKWTTQGQNSTVNLYYWKASTCATIGGAGTVIGSGLPDTSTAGYNWQVPDPAELSTGPVCARVQVTYPADETVFANSNNFWIVGGFKVVAPNGSADKWDVGSNQTIRWTSTSANIGTAKVYYATNGNATPPTWNELTAIAPNTGAQNAERAWAWNILPPTMTDQFKVKVAAANDPDASDESDISGKIKAYVHVNQPSAANITGTDSQIGLRVGDTYPITWATDPGQGSVPYVKLTYSTNANDPTPTWEDILDGASLMTPNDGSFTWTVPDAISSTVKIRVMNADDPDAVDISDNTFKIRGYFTLTQPNGGEPFKIYDATQNPNPESITWSTMGNVTSVDLIAYSTNPSDPVFRDGGGNVYTLSNPLVIASGLTNTPNGTTTFPWQVPDKASPSVKVKVINPLDPTVVYIDSAATFRIQGSFTVTYPPDANQVPAVGDQVWITWNKTGSSITQAKISYSTAGPSGPWNAVVESPIEGGSNDGIVANDGSFLWTVPDAVTISPTCYIKIEDPNDSTVNHVSANSFKIKAKYVFVSPPSGPPVRWVTNENRLISWTSSSSRTVNLIYSKDGFNSDTHPIASAVASSVGLNSLAWPGGVPDDRSQTVKIRITDAADPTVSLDSDYFKIEHYQITFEVRDQLSNNFISTLTANGANSNPLYTWAASGLNAPIVQPLPAGSWNVTFTQQDYGDKAVPVVADHDQTVTVYMESKVVHVWEVNTELSYDTVSDRLFISMVLKRDGVRVPGAVYGGIEFWDGSTLSKKFETSTTTVDPTTQAITPTSQVSPNAQGFYNFTWDPPTGLVSGKIYNVVATIINLTGGNIVTPRTFSITQAAQLQSVTDTVNQKLDTSLSQVNTNIQNTLTGQTTTLTGMIDNRLGFTADDIAAGKSLKSELAAQTGTINTATEEMKSTVQAGITNFTAQVSSSIVSLDESVEDSAVSAKNLEKAAADSQQSADNLEKVGKKYAARLLLPTAVLIGETLPIRYRAGEGLAPLVDIFTADADGKTITVVKSKPLIENTEKKGLYEFSIKVTKDAGFNPGKPATIFVKEETTGNLEAGAVFVETTTLGALEGLIASNSGSKAAIQQTLAAVNAVKGTLATGGDVGRALELLRTKVERIPKAVAEEGGTVQMRRTVSEVAERIKQLAGEEGYDFSQLVKKGMEEAPSIKDIRKKTDEVQGATELMQVLMERKMGGIDAPVVHVQVE